tara:strand:- start:236 stop:484 length:249 start_codon:yes stop_codon:yes gene_type:complete
VKRFLFPLLAALAFPIAVNANSAVKNSLNMADMYFRMGQEGVACNAVSLAILEASAPEVYGSTSSSLKREVEDYADRCDLRY